MIRKIFSAGMLITLGLACSAGAYSQVNPTPSRPGPVKGQPTRTKNPTIENIITSKLAIFTKNGKGTTSTSTVGEFAAQLAASATVDSEFSLEWSRSNPGKAESGQLYIRAVGNPNATPGFIPFLAVKPSGPIHRRQHWRHHANPNARHLRIKGHRRLGKFHQSDCQFHRHGRLFQRRYFPPTALFPQPQQNVRCRLSAQFFRPQLALPAIPSISPRK
jgi:hypothetical protein